MSKATERRARGIEVHPVYEVFEGAEIGRQMGWWARGHHDPAAFLAAIKHETYLDDPSWCYGLAEAPVLRAEDVSHQHWRIVPHWVDGEVEGSRFVPCGPGRGAFPVTSIEFRRTPTPEAPGG